MPVESLICAAAAGLSGTQATHLTSASRVAHSPLCVVIRVVVREKFAGDDNTDES